MSGSFEDIHVPPTLISFAVSATKAQNIVSGEFKAANDKVYLLTPEYDENGLPVYESIRKVFDHMESLIAEGKVKAVYTLGSKGIGEALCKMAFGNRIGLLQTRRFTTCSNQPTVHLYSRQQVRLTPLQKRSVIPPRNMQSM